MKLSSALNIIFLTWAYAGWFCCVLAGRAMLGPVVLVAPLATWLLLIFTQRPSGKACAKLLLLGAVGLLFDGAAVRLQWISVHGADTRFPFWLLALWLHFVPSLIVMRTFLKARLWLACIAGAILGPLSYESGEAFAVLVFSQPFAPLYYVIFWSAFLPLAIHWLNEKKEVLQVQLRNSHVLVTGASRGIGLAIAKEAAKRGAHVHAQVRTLDSKLEGELSEAGAASVKIWQADLGSREGVELLLNSLKNEKIDILINNAGQLTGGLLEKQPLNEIYSMFQVNLLALVQLTRGLIPGMLKRRQGKIVNNASVSAVMHFPCATTYAASKAAVLAFSNCLQAELSGSGVSCLCLLTPGIETRMFHEIEAKYGKNIEVPKDSITPEAYADLVCDAIESDETIMEPKGLTGLGLKVARHLPSLFRKAAVSRFQREER